MFQVDIDDAQVQRSLSRYRRNLAESASLMRKLSFALRDYVRETIRMGGRKRPYAPLAQMTRLRTGRIKPLLPLVNSIKSSYTPQTLSVFFEDARAAAEGWTIEQHHKGYTIPARQKLMVVQPRRGIAKPIFFRTAKATRVPAREVIPTRAEVNSVISGAVREWISQNRGLSDLR